MAQDQVTEERRGWFARLRGGLSKSASKIGAAITDRRLDEEALQELEDVLIASDLGINVAEEVISELRRTRFGKNVTAEETRTALAQVVARLVEPVAKPLMCEGAKPFVVLTVGVNGAGKTTTIGKLAKQFSAQGKKVMLAAGDTFRAAAVEQLKVWGQRSGCTVIAKEQGADAAGLAFEALQKAKAEGADILLIDTAGRLQVKENLMAELEKIVRVLKKVDDKAPHAVLLVLDATTGQNALSQAEIFRKVVGVTGIVMTKLDGSARGGVLVALAEKFGIPIHAIGVGEGIDDLRPFTADDFARGLVGLE